MPPRATSDGDEYLLGRTSLAMAQVIPEFLRRKTEIR
jgi:hypothetical protein